MDTISMPHFLHHGRSGERNTGWGLVVPENLAYIRIWAPVFIQNDMAYNINGTKSDEIRFNVAYLSTWCRPLL